MRLVRYLAGCLDSEDKPCSQHSSEGVIGHDAEHPSLQITLGKLALRDDYCHPPVALRPVSPQSVSCGNSNRQDGKWTGTSFVTKIDRLSLPAQPSPAQSSSNLGCELSFSFPCTPQFNPSEKPHLVDIPPENSFVVILRIIDVKFPCLLRFY